MLLQFSLFSELQQERCLFCCTAMPLHTGANEQVAAADPYLYRNVQSSKRRPCPTLTAGCKHQPWRSKSNTCQRLPCLPAPHQESCVSPCATPEPAPHAGSMQHVFQSGAVFGCCRSGPGPHELTVVTILVATQGFGSFSRKATTATIKETLKFLQTLSGNDSLRACQVCTAINSQRPCCPAPGK